MATATHKLTPTHHLILYHAARHPEGCVLPLPDGTGDKGGGGTRAPKSLLRRDLVQEEIAHPEGQEWARAENGEPPTLTTTPGGLAAIGVTESVDRANDRSAGEPVTRSAGQQSVLQARMDVEVGSGMSPEASQHEDAAIVEPLRQDAGE